ncbi:conserved hypothetical protein [Ricinus communis]|uniref:Uncharacterized protein n=1 Tax=Ricinus communis TaxID=3988 RepID=B9RXR3_RICCO|nr:conserved hypothetical protein [Ricinus communis]
MVLPNPFTADSGAGTKGYVHIRIQQCNGKKSLTTVQGPGAGAVLFLSIIHYIAWQTGRYSKERACQDSWILSSSSIKVELCDITYELNLPTLHVS